VSLICGMPATAQVADHLKCFKVKDSLAKKTYTATSAGSSRSLIAFRERARAA
jgi:hypothetical protein